MELSFSKANLKIGGDKAYPWFKSEQEMHQKNI